jgi:hypothetical protein
MDYMTKQTKQEILDYGLRKVHVPQTEVRDVVAAIQELRDVALELKLTDKFIRLESKRLLDKELFLCSATEMSMLAWLIKEGEV